MELLGPIPLYPDRLAERDLVEIVAAITMVARGAARRVRLINLSRPLAAAGDGAAAASRAAVEFRVERSGETVEIVVGPRRDAGQQADARV